MRGVVGAEGDGNRPSQDAHLCACTGTEDGTRHTRRSDVKGGERTRPAGNLLLEMKK